MLFVYTISGIFCARLFSLESFPENGQDLIDDILESIEAIESYVSDIGNFNDFASDRKTYSATIREYIIIG